MDQHYQLRGECNIFVIIIHEFHCDASLEQNFRAAEDMYIEREKSGRVDRDIL